MKINLPPFFKWSTTKKVSTVFIGAGFICFLFAMIFQDELIEFYADPMTKNWRGDVVLLEGDFSANKSLPTCLRLTEKLAFYGESAKALHYGSECEELGVQSTPINYAFNIWMAKAANDSGDDSRALHYLNLAFSQDTSHRISDEMLGQSGLIDIAKRLKVIKEEGGEFGGGSKNSQS